LRIWYIRKYLKLTQSEFGKSIGISGNYVSNLETGKHPPSNPILIALNSRYLIKPDIILSDDEFDHKKIEKYLDKVKQYQSTKNEISPSAIHVYREEISISSDPIDQIMQGFAQLFKDNKKELEKISSICKDLQERMSVLEEQDKKRISNTGSVEVGFGSPGHIGDATRKKET